MTSDVLQMLHGIRPRPAFLCFLYWKIVVQLKKPDLRKVEWFIIPAPEQKQEQQGKSKWKETSGLYLPRNSFSVLTVSCPLLELLTTSSCPLYAFSVLDFTKVKCIYFTCVFSVLSKSLIVLVEQISLTTNPLNLRDNADLRKILWFIFWDETQTELFQLSKQLQCAPQLTVSGL